MSHYVKLETHFILLNLETSDIILIKLETSVFISN